MKEKKRLFVILAAIVLAVCASCSIARPERALDIVIPTHPWETVSGKKLWYTLRWTYGDETRSMYVPSGEREVTLYVPAGETVLVAAFPLGDMSPFGAAVTPLDTGRTVFLTQNDGVVVGELLDIDRMVTSRLNYTLVSEAMREKTWDFRCIDKVTFLRDLQNGMLTEDSLKPVALFNVDSFAVANGIWTSEFISDPGLFVTDGMTSPMQLPEGEFRYLNTEMDRVLVLIVDNAGSTYSYLRQNLM